MTTIAWDGRYLAADTKETDQYGLIAKGPKIFEGNGWHVGFSGSTGVMWKWLHRHQNTTADILLNLTFEEAEYQDTNMLLIHDTQVYLFAKCAFAPMTCRKYAAIGSGRDFALMAMRLGNTAMAAVMLTSEFDNYTNDDIMSFDLKKDV